MNLECSSSNYPSPPSTSNHPPTPFVSVAGMKSSDQIDALKLHFKLTPISHSVNKVVSYFR